MQIIWCICSAFAKTGLRSMRARTGLAAIVIAGALTNSNAHPISDLPINLGDTVETVRAALGGNQKLLEVATGPQRGAGTLRVSEKGIWVFFDTTGRAHTIRLEAPFSGKLAGIEMGSTQAFVIERLGKPARRVKLPYALDESESLFYGIDGVNVRLSFDGDSKVQRMLLIQ